MVGNEQVLKDRKHDTVLNGTMSKRSDPVSWLKWRPRSYCYGYSEACTQSIRVVDCELANTLKRLRHSITDIARQLLVANKYFWGDCKYTHLPASTGGINSFRQRRSALDHYTSVIVHEPVAASIDPLTRDTNHNSNSIGLTRYSLSCPYLYKYLVVFVFYAVLVLRSLCCLLVGST